MDNCTICGDSIEDAKEMFCTYCKVKTVLNVDTLSKSLKKLIYFLSQRSKDTLFIDSKKLGILYTEDVLSFVKSNERLNIDVIGFDYNDNPIYSDTIKILPKEHKVNVKNMVSVNFENLINKEINNIKAEIKKYPNLYIDSMIDGLMILHDKDSESVQNLLINKLNEKLSIKWV